MAPWEMNLLEIHPESVDTLLSPEFLLKMVMF